MASKTAAGRTMTPRDDSKGKADASGKDEASAAKSEKSFFAKNKKLIIGLIVVAVLYVVMQYFLGGRSVKSAVEDAVRFVEKQGQTAVLWYCLFTLVGVVCLVPTTPMEIAGGFLFSPTYGMWTTLAFTGGSKLIANVISVLLARHVFKDYATGLVDKSAWMSLVKEAINDEPFKMTMLVRGSMAPLAVKNYGLGVMNVPYSYIAFGSMIFTNFYAFQNIYVGASCQNLAEVFAPKKAGSEDQSWMGVAKKMAPMAFNFMLVLFLVKAIKDAMNKQQAKLMAEKKAKDGDAKETKKDS